MTAPDAPSGAADDDLIDDQPLPWDPADLPPLPLTKLPPIPIPAGWTARSWAARCSYMASVSADVRPDLSAEWRTRAERLTAWQSGA